MSEQGLASTSVSVKRWIAAHPVAAFLLMLYPLSWILFVPAFLGRSGFGIISVDIPPQVSLLFLSLFGAIGLVFLVTGIADGKAGTRALRRHYYQFRAAPQWYAAAIFGPPFVLLLAGVLTHGTAVLGPIAANLAKVPAAYLVPVGILALLVNLWEEGMWMAFVTARLQRRVGPVWASLLVAPCFGFVHIPLFFLIGGLMDGRPPLAQFPLYVFLLLIGFSAQVRVLITWLFNSSGGSLPVVALFHASMDTTASVAILSTFYPLLGDGSLLYIGFAVIAVALIAVTRGRLGYRPESVATPVHSSFPATLVAVAKES